jgi:hypothetical protein
MTIRALTSISLSMGAAVSVGLALLLACGAARGVEREPETSVRCLRIGGAAVEWAVASTVGPPGSGRLDWPGASDRAACRPRPLPAGMPGEKVERPGAR